VRIEPREVEAAILACPEVAQAAATWFAGPDGARSIVAAVVVRGGRALSPVQLHTQLAARLPPAMIPARWLFLDALPLAPSGKVDRNAIRAAAAAREVSAPAGRALTPTEETLAGIWRRILGAPAVAADDHFFSIGGDSLAAVRMITEAEQRLGVELPVQTVFEAPTLARLAARIDGARAERRHPGESEFLFPLVEGAGGRPLFFSNVDLKLAQRGAWPLPGALWSISHWAQGRGFVEADSVEALARAHLERVRVVQPQGPYRIAGYSFGGLVAFEMAQQLRAAGQEVELLFLLDPMQPYRTEAAPRGYAMAGQVTPLDETWPGWAARHTRNLVRDPRRIGAYVGQRLRWHARMSPLRQWFTYRLVHFHSRRPNPISAMILPQDRWPAFWYAARRMAQNYVARPYAGPVLAVFPAVGERQAAWKNLLGPHAKEIMVPVEHRLLFDEPARSQWMQPLVRVLDGAAVR
jgi:thioesterase domain-containing protein/acyl carrier protein